MIQSWRPRKAAAALPLPLHFWEGTMDYLEYLVNEIHTTVVATVDDAGLPVTAAIHQENCLHCGNCYEICPARAIVKRR